MISFPIWFCSPSVRLKHTENFLCSTQDGFVQFKRAGPVIPAAARHRLHNQDQLDGSGTAQRTVYPPTRHLHSWFYKERCQTLIKRAGLSLHDLLAQPDRNFSAEASDPLLSKKPPRLLGLGRKPESRSAKIHRLYFNFSSIFPASLKLTLYGKEKALDLHH